MLLSFWNYIRGFVTIEVTGFSVERFVNLAVRRGVHIWNAERDGSCMRMNVSVRGFFLLKGCARKTGCHFKIARKTGLPFIMRRYRGRKVLMGGLVFSVLALYALSSFVWLIDISGQERLSQDAILTYCEALGLRVGAFKRDVDASALQGALQERFPDIGWIDIHIKGTRATIKLAETLPKQPVIDRETPCHIIAAKDGLITGIITSMGHPLVKIGDVVRQGEILVSGILETESDVNGPGVLYMHANAEVWAKRYTTLTFEVPFTYEVKVYTGRETTRYAALLLFAGGQRVNIPGTGIPFEQYDKITHRAQPGVSGDYPLPFVWIADRYTEFIPETRSRTLDEATELAERIVTSRILREFDFQSDIIDKQIAYTETQNGLHVNALITTNERIDNAVSIE